MATPLSIPSFEEFQRRRPGVWPPPIRWRRWSPQPAAPKDLLADTPAAWREDRRLLHDKCVVVMGLGAVGSVCFEQLARLGVGRLYGLDPDRYGAESWLTQPASKTDQSRLKAHVQGRRAALANPATHVATSVAFAQDAPLAVLRQADVIVLAGDNLELLVWAGEYAAGLGKVVVQGAVHGATQQAIVRGFDLSNPNAVCPTCLLAEDDWNRMTSRLGCDPATVRLQGLEPTQTLPHVCALAGQMAAGEVLQWLLGRTDLALSGAEVQYNLPTHRVLRTAYSRKATCRAPHRQWRISDAPQPWRTTTLADLTNALRAPHKRVSPGNAPTWQVRAEIPWITRASCWPCGKVQAVRRFSRLGRKVGRCGCGGPLWADLEGRRSMIPPADLEAVWRQPLARLGLQAGQSVALCHEDDMAWFILS